jgi:hypothetical protein
MGRLDHLRTAGKMRIELNKKESKRLRQESRLSEIKSSAKYFIISSDK